MAIKRKPTDLFGFVASTTYIECSKCKEQSSIFNCDEYDAINVFFKTGWRATGSNCFCPKCAKKYLKNI